MKLYLHFDYFCKAGKFMKNTMMVFLLLIFILSVQSFAEDSQTIEKSRIIVGGEIGYPPYSYLDKNGEPAGFSVDLTRSIARVMGLDIEIKLMPWEIVRKGIDDGTIDIIPGMFYSEERAKNYDFSTPFSIVSSSIFIRKKSQSLESIDDLRNKEIIIMRGEVMHDYVVKHQLTDKLLLTDTIEDALRLLASGKGDLALLADTPGRYWIKELKLTNIVTTGKSLEPFKNCYAVRKGDVLLLSRFNEGLNILKNTGEYNKLYDNWLGVLEVKHISIGLLIKYGVFVLIPLLIIIIMSLFWSWMLRLKVNEKTQKLRASEEHIRSINNNMQSGMIYQAVIEKDGKRKFTYLSDSIKILFGVTPEEGMADSNLIYNKINEEDQMRLQVEEEYAITNISILKTIIRINPHSGDVRWGSVVSKPRLRDDGLICFDGIVFDITERQMAEELIKAKNDELEAVNEELNAAMEEMAATNEELISTSDELQNNQKVLLEALAERKISEQKVITLLAEKNLLLREVHHRIKNNMNTIKGLLTLQLAAEDNPSVTASLRDAESRIQSMIILYDRLYCTDNYRELSVKGYLVQLAMEIIGSFSGKPVVNITTNIEDYIINVQILTPLGIIINELLTNIMKYAFTGKDSGNVSVSITVNDGHVCTTVQDDGVGMPPSITFENSTGFGLQLVWMLTQQLHGEIRIERDNGTKVVLEFDI